MRIKNTLIPLCITIFMAVIFMFIYVPTYAINDDVMIDSILSGSFQKVYPYTYYFSAPLGALISALYLITMNIPWFGIFLIGANICSIFAIEYVACNRAGEGIKKSIVVAISIVLILCLQLSGFVLPHYTVVAASLGAAGLWLFISSQNEKQFIAPIIFFVMTYLVRENVFFMLLPFVGIAFIYLLIENKGYDWKKYLKYAISFVLASAVLIIINRALLSTDEWNSYKDFNKIRTDVYDYTGIPTDEDALAFYETQGIDEADIALIKSYDLALGDLEDVRDKLEIIADYAYGKKNEAGFIAKLREAVIAYKYRLINEKTDAPYNYLLLGIYGIALLYSVTQKKFIKLIPLALLGIYGRVIWIYLFFGGRYPERVTMSLYIMEIILLVGIIVREVVDNKSTKRPSYFVMAGLFAAFVIGSIMAINKLDVEYSKVSNTNSSDDMIYSYMYDHMDEFYFMDVYATVARTKPVLEVSRYSPHNFIMQDASLISHPSENYMILGGWMLKHPLYNRKVNEILGTTGASSISEMLCTDSSFHIVAKDGVGAGKEQLSCMVGAEAKIVDSIETGDGVFYIYSFCE